MQRYLSTFAAAIIAIGGMAVSLTPASAVPAVAPAAGVQAALSTNDIVPVHDRWERRGGNREWRKWRQRGYAWPHRREHRRYVRRHHPYYSYYGHPGYYHGSPGFSLHFRID